MAKLDALTRGLEKNCKGKNWGLMLILVNVKDGIDKLEE